MEELTDINVDIGIHELLLSGFISKRLAKASYKSSFSQLTIVGRRSKRREVAWQSVDRSIAASGGKSHLPLPEMKPLIVVEVQITPPSSFHGKGSRINRFQKHYARR